MRPGPQPDRLDQQRNYVPAVPVCEYERKSLLGATRQTYMHGLQMVKQLGPPLEMFEARKVRQGEPITTHTRLGTLVKKPIPGTRGLGDSNETKRRGGIA